MVSSSAASGFGLGVVLCDSLIRDGLPCRYLQHSN